MRYPFLKFNNNLTYSNLHKKLDITPPNIYTYKPWIEAAF